MLYRRTSSPCQRCVSVGVRIPAAAPTCHSSAIGRTAKTMVHSLISPRLDYCNSLLFGISDNLFVRLQAVAARLVTGIRRRELITPVLRQLHWLPVRQSMEFKLAVLVYKSLNGLYPLTSTTGRRRLRSSNVTTCQVPRTHTNLGDCSFTVAGRRL